MTNATQQLQILGRHVTALERVYAETVDPAKKAEFANDLAALRAAAAALGGVADGGMTAPMAAPAPAPDVAALIAAAVAQALATSTAIVAPPVAGGSLSPEKGALLRKAVREGDRALVLSMVGGENGWAVCPATDKEKAIAVFGSEAAAKKAAANTLFAEILDSAERAGYTREMGEALAGDATTRAVRAAIADGRAAAAAPAQSAEINWRMVATVTGAVVVVAALAGGAYVAYDKYGR